MQTVRSSNHFHNAGDEDLAMWWKNDVLNPLYQGVKQMHIDELDDCITSVNLIPF